MKRTITSKHISSKTLLSATLFLLIVTNRVFGVDAKLYYIPNGLMILFFLLMIYAIFKGGMLKFSRSLLLPIIFFLLEAASCLWAYDFDAAAGQLKTQTPLFILFFFIYIYSQSTDTIGIYFKAAYAAGYMLAVYAVYKYGITGFFQSMYQGARLGNEVMNENSFGIAFATAAIIAFYYAILKGKKWNIISVVIFSIFAFSSGSKKAFLMILAGFVVISVIEYGISRIWKTLLLLLIISFAVVIVFNLPMFKSISDRIGNYYLGIESGSDMARESHRQNGLAMIKTRPLLGFGLANYSAYSNTRFYSHDNFIEIATGMGLIGLVIYYLPFVISAVKLFVWSIKRKHGSECVVVFALVAIQIVFGYGMVQFYSKGPWILLAIVLAFVDRRDKKRNLEINNISLIPEKNN